MRSSRPLRPGNRVRVMRVLTALTVSLALAHCAPPRPRGEPGEVREGALFDSLDADHDGRLSPDEFGRLWERADGSRPEFDRLDTNHDGWVSRDELGAARFVIFRW